MPFYLKEPCCDGAAEIKSSPPTILKSSEAATPGSDRLDNLIANNREWAEAIKSEDPTFFERLSRQHTPEYLWIGCSDSRVPANQITGMDPGEIFVHRNIANLVLHTDLNALSVIHYALEYLKVKHIIVCGHHGCGGVAAAYDDKPLGLIDNWLGNIKDVYQSHKKEIECMPDRQQKIDRLCELNVRTQVKRVAKLPIVLQAWERGQDLTIHGWIYGIQNGLIEDLNVHISGSDQVEEAFRRE
jgi:carbonic anhydrase